MKTAARSTDDIVKAQLAEIEEAKAQGHRGGCGPEGGR